MKDWIRTEGRKITYGPEWLKKVEYKSTDGQLYEVREANFGYTVYYYKDVSKPNEYEIIKRFNYNHTHDSLQIAENFVLDLIGGGE